MSPTSSRAFLVGRNARSATLRTTPPPPQSTARAGPGARRPERYALPRSAANRQPSDPTALRRSTVCYGRAAVPGRRPRRWRARGAALVLALVALAGCGGGDQSADEPAGSYPVQVLRTSFPRAQHLAQRERFVVVVRNAGHRAI